MSAKNPEKKIKKSDKTENFDLPEQPESWFSNGLHRFMIVFSVMWFGIVAIYITKFFGWDNLFSMMPNEFSGFIAGISLPLAIVWVVMAYIDRGNSFRNETQMLRDSLNRVIFPDSNGNAATKMIADAIKAQVSELKETTRDVCAQADVIKRDLSDRIAEMKSLAGELDTYSSQTMQELNSEIKKLVENFTFVAEKAASTTADFRVNTMQIREDSEQLSQIMKPMVNEMVTAAENIKEVVNVNNENIEKAQAQLNNYSESSQLAIGRIIESWAEKGENLEKTFLRTAENCEELFHRLDSGISHIENSINEQKTVVEKQSAILDKNSGYLDKKLGEYGKLISLEVEAMIERSNTLEQNIQAQMKNIKEASQQTEEIFGRLGTDISDKRQLLETEGSRMVNNIHLTVGNLGEEVARLQDFYKNTQDKNSELGKVFSSIAQTLKEMEDGLLASVNNFSSKAGGVVDKFNEVNSLVSGNIGKLSETADSIANQSKTNAGLLIEQDEYVNKSLASLKQISSQIAVLNKDMSAAAGTVGKTLAAYENKMSAFSKVMGEHLNDLNENYDKTQKQYDEFNQKFKVASIDSFMKNSADIISELETISIDINSIFNKTGDDEVLWKKYYEGDHSVFVRYLSKNMTKKEVVAVREDYEKKPDFRVVVDKYLDDFNSLIEAARSNNRASTLLALISGSDIGKVYYILSRALGKVN
ncbi:MAG: hypothetical protein MSS98_01050 [Alphaproteobacteria bacterium]|nr:hypothetical protein [Alphaproteobacteria bacterium]MDY4690476.1 hypothetical protein [Alphaproteobacteria bacterium]